MAFRASTASAEVSASSCSEMLAVNARVANPWDSDQPAMASPRCGAGHQPQGRPGSARELAQALSDAAAVEQTVDRGGGMLWQ